MSKEPPRVVGCKKDCFAYRMDADKVEYCDALEEMVCRHSKTCRFYKTKIQFQHQSEELKRKGNR